jgi:23S rRNA pseudouridine2605 synthase
VATPNRKYTPSKKTSEVGLARILSKLGYCSRSQAETIIRDGRVTVGGIIQCNPLLRYRVDDVAIAVDGKALGKKKFIYIIMNKPVGVVTTRSDERGRRTVYDLLDEVDKWIFPVGRLDKDTSGLLLLTNDNRLGERLTNPHSKVPKMYLVELNTKMAREHIKLFQQGMELGGEQLLPAKIQVKEGTTIEMTIHEGKNRQIRRTCEEFGYEVVKLRRVKIGGLEIGKLEEGEWRFLKEKEVNQLLNQK